MHQGRIRDGEQTSVAVDLVQSVEDGPDDDGERPVEAVGFPETTTPVRGHGGGISVHEAQRAGGGCRVGVGVGDGLAAVGFGREEWGVGSVGMRRGSVRTRVGFCTEE